MNGKKKLIDSLSNLRKAVDQLGAALQIPKDRELVVEGTIQRFESVVELVWKTLRRALAYEGLTSKTPRQTMRQAFSAGMLSNEIVWQELLDKRNKTSHEYLDESFIEDYYNDISRLFPPIETLLNYLEKEYLD